MQLSRYFTLAELTRSDTASRRNIPNVPNIEQTDALRQLAIHILDPIRLRFGPFSNPNGISSGYRSPALNRAVGGAVDWLGRPTSQHCKGQAVDVNHPRVDNLELAHWVATTLPFDQLLLEFYSAVNGRDSGWVHISYKHSGGRRMALTTPDGRRFTNGLPPLPTVLAV